MRKKRKSGDGGFNVWRSYSDVMAGVLLLFILIMSLTLFQAQKSYDESIQERDEKLALQAEYTADLLAKQNTIEEQEGTIKTKDEKLTALAQTLAEQEAKLKEQQALLNQQQTDLDEKTTQLSEQQTKIDNIIGVKAEVVEALQKEFQKNNINVNLDSQTGALTLDASVLFDVDESELTDAGKEALRNVLPIYCKVLMEDTYKNYLAEIIIDGYTDTDGEEIFKEAVSSYDFSSYEIYYGLRLLESYDFGYESDVEGDVIFFAEPGFSKPRICLEDRYRPDNRMQVLKAVYELPVELPEEVEE